MSQDKVNNSDHNDITFTSCEKLCDIANSVLELREDATTDLRTIYDSVELAANNGHYYSTVYLLDVNKCLYITPYILYPCMHAPLGTNHNTSFCCRADGSRKVIVCFAINDEEKRAECKRLSRKYWLPY